MKKLPISIKEQKNEECLSECLLSVFQYKNIPIDLDEIITKISTDSDKLYDWEYKAGNLFLEKGLKPTIYTNVSYLFDPSWHSLGSAALLEKLEKEAKYFQENLKKINKEPEQKNYIFPNKLIAKRYKKEVDAIITYLKKGGKISFEPISVSEIKKHIDADSPVIVSLSPTLLHKMKRAYNFAPDDIRGITWGHVVIIIGYNEDHFIIADPGGNFYKNAFEYEIGADSIVEAVLRYNGQMIVVA